MNKQLEQTLDSREVAEMVGKEHSKLLRDIRTYIEQLNQSKIGFVEFFRESTYKDSKGEERPQYNITKKGCEFIAHKLTGIKGTEFTACYINRFHNMEDTIKKGISGAEKQSKPKKKELSSTNMLVQNVNKIFTKAGVDPVYIAAEKRYKFFIKSA